MRSKEAYAISTFALIDQPLETAVEQLMHEGWKKIELMCEDGHRVLLDWSYSQLAKLKEAGLRHGVSWSLHAPVYTINPCAANPAERSAGKAVLHRTMDIAEYLNCSYVVLHAGQEDGPTDGDAALARCASFLSEVLAERSPASPLMLALENVPPKEKLHGVSPSFVRSVVERVGDSRMKILFDVGHAHVFGQNECLSGLRLCLPHLVGMHLNDNLGDYDSHLAIGMGTIPYSRLIELLNSHGFRGNWVIETETTAYAEMSVKRLMDLHDELAI
jgi:sugar phosphate isomerase/epimerase